MIGRGELEKRFDPFYYVPSIVELERKVWAKNAIPLRNFIKRMASGATPSKNEEEKFYTTKTNNGVPFVRVQNLSETSELLQDDLRYINNPTHEFYLRRSQIKEGDLLTKITGVGRMAVSAVVPKGFSGNINQHIVVSKTQDANVSEVLAAYLNSDLGEKLASRRSTGGTRPALDYPALRSIPVVYKPEIVPALKEAVLQKHQKEQQAQELLNSIDDYLLQELGIELPAQTSNNVQNRMFKTSWQKVAGRRLDSYYHKPFFEEFFHCLAKGKYPLKSLRTLSSKIASGATPKAGGEDYTNALEGIPFVRSGELNQFNRLDFPSMVYVKKTIHEGMLKSSQLRRNDILIAIVGATIGSVAVYEDDRPANINQAIALVRPKQNVVPEYIKTILLSAIGKILLDHMKRPVARANINLDEIGDIVIPLPDLKKQREIVGRVWTIRQQSLEMMNEAQHEFNQAKKEIERMILE